MKRFKLLIATFAVAVLGAFALVPATTVSALDPLADVCGSGGNSTICNNQNENAEDLIGTLVDVLLFIVGALAVIMIVVSGIFYIISGGDAGKVARAKNMLLYSIIGLVVAFIAFALVNWVFNEL